MSYYESGDRYPSYDVLVKTARIFHTTTDYLLDVERKRVIDVSNLTEDNIALVISLVEALNDE